jgi:hypothetical protein
VVDVDLAVLTWFEDLVGRKLVAYMLGYAEESVSSLASGSSLPTGGQVSVLRQLSVLRAQVSALRVDLRHNEVVCSILTQLEESDKSPARSFRLLASGTEEVVAGEDELENIVAAMALDAYPIFLLPPESDPFPQLPGASNSRLSPFLYRHPQAAEFIVAALQDEILKEVFSKEEEHVGRVATVMRNTGSGGGIQLAMLPNLIIQNAWRHLLVDDVDPQKFAEQAVAELRLVRDTLAGRRRKTTARVAFAGVLLPSGAEFEVGTGKIRAITEADRMVLPDLSMGTLTGTDESGMTTTIRHDGDVVFEYRFPYKVKASPGLRSTTSSWPADLLPSADLEWTFLRIRFSLILAVERESRVHLVQTWRMFDDPLDFGQNVSWKDPRNGAGMNPIQLTGEEVAAWVEWYRRLETKSVARIELAITRILRAIAERREPSDVLIDSVVAWENLFGTKLGEPTFRVTMCIAKLLEESLPDRLTLRSKLGRMYTLRSDIVHGNCALKVEQYALCYEALDVAIRVVRVLLKDRMDILELPDGARRSETLLLAD